MSVKSWQKKLILMIYDWNDIYIEESGIIKKTNIRFRSADHIRNLVEKILGPLGLRVDESSPMVDARLDDGSRINIVLKPVSTNDVVMTIRKFKRIITIEDTLELSLSLNHVVRLESRPPNLEGKGEITIRDLVRNSLRMRPERIIVGEIRGAEAVAVLQAMNKGHSGSMTTVHSNSPKDLVSRLETMILMSGLNLDPSTARRMMASSIDMIIHLGKLQNGKRILLKISELINKSESMGGSTTLEVKDIYKYLSHNIEANNDKLPGGSTDYTGYIPAFMDKIKNHGFNFNFGDENER